MEEARVCEGQNEPRKRGIIDDILENHDEIVTGTWRGQPSACDFYIKGEDVVVRNEGESLKISFVV